MFLFRSIAYLDLQLLHIDELLYPQKIMSLLDQENLHAPSKHGVAQMVS